MLPLLGIVTDLFPDIIKQLGAPLHEQSGSLQDQIIDTIKKMTATSTEEAAHEKLTDIKDNTDPANEALKEKLQSALNEIAQLELQQRNRANEEAARVELERYRMDAEEREQVRDQQFQEYLLSLQDVQAARSTQMQLAEEQSPLAWVAPILAFVLVGMIWYLLHGILTAREQVINRDVFNVVLGALVTAFTTVVAYYFGSSLGSSKKDEALSNGRLQTNPNMADRTSSDPDDGGSPEPTPLPSSGPGKTSDPTIRASKPTPVPTGIYGLFRQKAPGIMRDLIHDLGLSATQAAGILGNIGWECGGFKQLQEQNPVMGGRGGLGWCQWTATRRTEFEEWLSRNGFNYQNDAANYGFLLNELRGSQAASVRAVRQTPNLENATSEFMRVFERPAAPYAHLEDRIGLAKLALQEYERAFNA
jgi:tail lysozyme